MQLTRRASLRFPRAHTRNIHLPEILFNSFVCVSLYISKNKTVLCALNDRRATPRQLMKMSGPVPLTVRGMSRRFAPGMFVFVGPRYVMICRFRCDDNEADGMPSAAVSASAIRAYMYYEVMEDHRTSLCVSECVWI